MDFQNDPELEKLFKDELDERSSSLASGARAMAEGELTMDLAGRMLREGHTIKGTGRVMGYEGIARGGETSEFVWRWIQQGDLQPSSMLARTLEHLANAIPGALAGDDVQISVAIDTVRAIVSDPTLVDQLPEPLVSQDVTPPSATPPSAPSAEATATSEAEAEDPSAGSSEPDGGADATVLDADGVADVAATLDEIEREIAARAGSEKGADPADGAPGPDPVDDAPGSPVDIREVHGEQDAVDAAEGVSEHVIDLDVIVDDPDEGDEPKTRNASRSESTAADDEMGDGPLVFEPGPDGRLPTPVITYEIVSSAFADVTVGAVSPSKASRATGSLDEPPGLTLVDSGESALDPANAAVYDLGGLVGAVETWASEESVPVNAGRLFRMINDVAALRIDLESAMTQTSHLLQTAEGVSAVAIEGTLESLETIRRASVKLEGAALGLTSMPLAGVTATLPQLTKYISKKVGRDIELVIEGEDTVVDRQLVDRIGEVIRQLVVNAVAHGIESTEERTAAGKPSLGMVKVGLSRNEQHVQIVVADDGAGIDWKAVREAAGAEGLVSDDPSAEELRSVLYSEGFSTSPGQTEFTGDGEGLARVTDIVEQVFGTMTLDSTPGRGTTFVVTMPAHRALQRAQIFSAGGRSWGIPDSSVIAISGLQDVTINVSERGSFVARGSESIPYSSFATVVGLDVEGLPSEVMIIQSPTGAIALSVDDVGDLREVATKDLSPLLSGSSSVVSGVALLGGDETVMLVDAGRLAEKMREVEVRPEGPVHSVLVVDDSQGVRQVVSGVLASHGFSTLSAGSVSDALAVLAKHTVDALVVDFSMPRADGVALIHMVRQRYGDIPVVMLSGVASEEDRTRAERAGADAFFDKADFAKGALIEKLRELIDTEPASSEADMAS
jgi:chemotaxis protein histidine kinase CheA/ActR/RegA family two-component response regulator